MSLTTHQVRASKGMCMRCGMGEVVDRGNCDRCHEIRRRDAAMRRFDRKVDREEVWRNQGLIPANEVVEVLHISLRRLSKLVYMGRIKPAVRNPYGGFNWYRERDVRRLTDGAS